MKINYQKGICLIPQKGYDFVCGVILGISQEKLAASLDINGQNEVHM